MNKKITLRIIIPLILVSVVATILPVYLSHSSFDEHFVEESIFAVGMIVCFLIPAAIIIIHEVIIKRINSFKDVIAKRDRGSKNAYVNVSGRDEIYDFACVFNEMLEKSDRYEASLKENEKKFNDIEEAILEYVWEIDPEGRYIFASRKVFDILGYQVEEILGKTIFEMATESQREHVESFISDTIFNRKTFERFEYQVLTRSGKMIWLELTGKPLFDANGNLYAFRGAALDITQNKINEEKIKIYVLDLERKQEQLKDAINVAENAARMKSEFLANMSHEIRTPMNGIMGMANLLAKTGLNDEQKSYLKTIIHSSESLLEIVTDILDFSKIEAGRIELEKVPFDLFELSKDIIDLISPKASEKDIELLLRFAPDTPRYLIGDPARIRQIFINLLSNSIKFTEEGHICLDIRLKEKSGNDYTVRCSVKDTGIGIPEDKQSLIFNKFDQADSSTTRKFGGTGLGLAICKEIAQMMGGEIGVYSAPGAGSNFWFTVNLKGDLMKDIPEIDNSSVKGKDILIIDDVVTSQNILVESFEYFGGKVKANTNLTVLGDEGVNPDIMVYALNDSSKFQNLENYVKKHIKRSRTTVVVIAAVPDMVSEDQIKDVADIFYVHPINFYKLLEALSYVADSRKQGRKISLINSYNLNEVKNPEAAQAIREEEEAALQFEDMDVMIVEDNQVNRLVIKKILEKYNLNITEAVDGGEAVGKVKRKKFDIIFMDCQMPNMDGYEATRVIREVEIANRQTRTPIVALTANAIAGDDEKCYAAGMDSYLAKPVKVDEVEAVLKRWLKRSSIG